MSTVLPLRNSDLELYQGMPHQTLYFRSRLDVRTNNFTCLKSASNHAPYLWLFPAAAAKASFACLTPIHPSSSSLLPKTSNIPEWVKMSLLPPQHTPAGTFLGYNCLQSPLPCKFHKGKSHVLGSTKSLAPSPKSKGRESLNDCIEASTHSSARFSIMHQII